MSLRSTSLNVELLRKYTNYDPSDIRLLLTYSKHKLHTNIMSMRIVYERLVSFLS